MSKIRGIVFTILAVCIIVPGIFFVFFFYWYTGVVDVPVVSETVREKLDAYFLEKYNKRNPIVRFLHGRVFGNADKYAWYPPRPVPVYSKRSGAFTGYEVYGMVSSWEPGSYTLRMRSYNRQDFVVRFNPELDNSIAVVAPMDQYGAIPSVSAISIVNSPYDRHWFTLFCPSDIVAVLVGSKLNIVSSSERSPVIPKHIRLVRRLCKNV